MLNKKGFTVVEVVVSFSLVSVMLVSLISATMFYRDKIKEEEVKSQLLDFKNTITKVVYDDIINYNFVRVESCVGGDDESGSGSGTCVKFYNVHGDYHVLKLVENTTGEINKKGVYISYDDVKYWLPDSDLGNGNERVCDFVGNFVVKSYDNKLYKVKLSFRHKDLNLNYNILYIIG